VSEETGNITVVVDGQIERGLTPDLLRARLRSLVLQRASAPTDITERGEPVAVGISPRRLD
jgi:hypothetical protein